MTGEDVAAAIRQAERAVWAALVAGDAVADRSYLADDFLGVYPDGFAGRDAHCDQLRDGPTVTRFEIFEDHIRPLGLDHVLYAYHARYWRPGAENAEDMMVSSIWERRANGWINTFSQDTPLTGTAVP